jgi:hypothetical protein
MKGNIMRIPVSQLTLLSVAYKEEQWRKLAAISLWGMPYPPTLLGTFQPQTILGADQTVLGGTWRKKTLLGE